jgi:putative DNA primase/helicase
MSHSNGAVAEPPAWFFDPDNQFSAPPPAAKQPAAQATEPALMPRFKPTSLAGLLARPPFEWMIENIIGTGDTMMIYGPSGSGKTFVVIDFIFACCLGQQFAMRFDVARPLNVAYAAGEGLGGLPKRFAAAASFYGVEDLTNFTFYDSTPQLFQADSADSMKIFVDEYKQRQQAGEAQQLDILFLDTLHAATVGANENAWCITPTRRES